LNFSVHFMFSFTPPQDILYPMSKFVFVHNFRISHGICKTPTLYEPENVTNNKLKSLSTDAQIARLRMTSFSDRWLQFTDRRRIVPTNIQKSANTTEEWADSENTYHDSRMSAAIFYFNLYYFFSNFNFILGRVAACLTLAFLSFFSTNHHGNPIANKNNWN